MQKFVIAFGALAFSGSAFAADVSPGFVSTVPVPSWTACSIGANAGLGWQYNSAYDPLAFQSTGRDTGLGVVGGGQIGCDLQFAGSWVVGIQAMFDGAYVNGTHTVPFSYSGDYSETMSFKTTWFGTATGRIGYAFLPPALLYLKGGVAWAHINYTDADPDAVYGLSPSGQYVLYQSPYSGQAAATLSGWTAGIGLEYLFRPNWSVFLEYDYIDLGTHNVTLNYNDGSQYTYQVSHNLQMMQVGFNYRFSGW